MWISTASVLGTAPWRPVRQLGAGLDLARSTGPGYAWSRWREERMPTGESDETPNAAYREIWPDAAAALGIDLSEHGEGWWEVRGAGVRVRFQRGHVPIDGDTALDLALDKPRHYRSLRDAGLPVPDHQEFAFNDLRAADAFLGRTDGPCVVKPARGTGGGSGVTTGVTDRSALFRARLRASRSDTRLLIERQIGGDVYRALVLDGELLDVVRRRPPRLTGDGDSTVAELLAAENRRRQAGDAFDRLRMLKLDLDAVLTLGRQGLGVRSIPDAGAIVVVKQVVNQNAPADNETVRDALAPELVGELLVAARASGLRLVGIDLATPDLGGSLAAAGGVVLEVNGGPGIHHHYGVRERRDATPVAVPILRRLLEQEPNAT